MKASEPKTEMEEILEAECLEILGQHSLGRIAVAVDGQPQIFPVNYAMSGRIIAIRTASGTKLSHAPNSKVSFEIDDYDASAGVGWSVIVQGVAVDATEAFDDVSWEARAAAPWALAPGAKPYWLAIEPNLITGRRFQVRPASGI
jgi:nitroimidazol reductase NimA-like FMN-containing flavoprotein (pyridoxamine 5'-phosphate oxidase superfamily)